MFAVAFPIVVWLCLTWVTLGRREAWPFSPYPMFALPRRASLLRFFHARFELPDGRVVGFQRQSGRLADEFNTAFATAWQGAEAPADEPARVVRDFLARAAREDAALLSAESAEVVVRLAQFGATDGVTVTEQIVWRLDRPGLRLDEG